MAMRVKLSYEFAKAIPTDNPKYIAYQSFRQKFGDDGNLLVIAVKTDHLFEKKTFQSFLGFQDELKNVKGVETIQSLSSAFNLLKDTASQKLKTIPVFKTNSFTQEDLDSSRERLKSLLFYKGLLYNSETNVYLVAIGINKELINSSARTGIVKSIVDITNKYSKNQNIECHLSGLPLIRTLVADRVSTEMKLFLIGSLLLSAIILIFFFRSVSTMLLALGVVIVSVIWSFGILYLFGFKITLLNALIPPLVVVIGIPNCIYFLNKYHSTYIKSRDKPLSLIEMVSKMGVVTLFCNITAAIGFGVFAFTQSAILKEFGIVAGISIMMIFVISFILLPAVLSYLPAPKAVQMKYLNSKLFGSMLSTIERWVIYRKKAIYVVTIVVVLFSIAGVLQLKSEGHIVDDLPKKDKIYTDMKFFEANFKGVMPLEIVVDTKKKYGLAGLRVLPVLQKMDSLADYISLQKETSRPLSIAEGLKFVKQAFYDGDTLNYVIPNSFDAAFVGQYLKPAKDAPENNFTKVLSKFIDSGRQSTRMSVNMADVGTKRLPVILTGIQAHIDQLFDSSKYSVTLTGSTITFLEGSRFIINGLKDSILWAFILIAVCMLYLFRSFKILLCSIIPNIIPLLITAGIMGWAGIALRPSTVLIFSVALGIAIDVTIRFLVNYKQELPLYNGDITKTITETIQHTGLSILYTSIVLVAGFIIFCFSSFGGTQALGWLTSLTLFSATLTNLILLPVLLLLLKNKN
ncbi:MAG: MMPL family transporter [Ginsengibacter sp.]